MRIKIEIEDSGLKSSHEFESQDMSKSDLKEKIMNFLLASGIFEETSKASQVNKSMTIKDKLKNLINFEFSDRWFASQTLKARYDLLEDEINISTVSTYLTRMALEGTLEKRGNARNREYRFIMKADQSAGISNNLNVSGSYNTEPVKQRTPLLAAGHVRAV